MVKLRQLVVAGCATLGLGLAASLGPSQGSDAPQAARVPAGAFIAGSDAVERDYGYQLDEIAYGHDRTRQARWYDGERPRGGASTEAFLIMLTPVTNAAYAEFVRDTGHPAPDVDAKTWTSYGLVHPFERTRRHAWAGVTPPRGREAHPVVLVSHADAEDYAAWLSAKTGQSWRLPSELEWEKAARGTDGRRFPWGDTFDPERLNSHDRGPFDTTPVGSFPMGASPYGVLDMAGQVFEWTATPTTQGRYVVKGGSWDDKGCGVCRAAARHSRPAALKHILIGFRLVVDAAPAPD
jgi:formylglycine-generating enzyme required for sulfatase activity